ncbi:Hyaluronan synthase [Serratia entomophila]|jgi:heptose III glucuronosyltransferase|uniref:Glycosyltransferase n=1 Tax=Serratia entomophila TaxID=42906 RepID=A0ABY5CN25_9GAMM|nr:glycosyltransferase [Serratia entomophila]UIW16535.1 glycosyltransferase [Serratia entomophila]USU99091.1 glycosyltransferase [Serratia entomophila]CAI0765836.1 Hyaluronan synthase [Serratia entomophila]CAI1101524.1 Hyaluronan synthase [Serratia entomophila]CAI1106928.1 Hyaluronan synthase [Serratia entomophila]
MSLILSVIVPLHNAGELFEPFLASLLAQRERRLEVIIVNDGSTDGSGDIAHRYAAEYPHIKVIDQANSGVSNARNAGLAMAKGKYVAFPDADDLLAPDMYSTLIELAERHQLDVMQCNGERYFASRDELQTIFPLQRLSSTEVISGVQWFERALKSRKFIHVVWLAVYRLDFIRQHRLYFEPGLHHQDIPWTTEVMYNAQRVKYLSKPLYRQRVHDQSISNRRRTGKANVQYQRHYMKIVDMLQQLNRRYANKIAIRPAFHWQIAREALGICHSIRREPELAAQRQITEEFCQRGIDKAMAANARGLKQGWHVLLWQHRLKQWRGGGACSQTA